MRFAPLLLPALLLLPAPAYAYIDPGTGSYVVQVIAAGVLGALYTLKVYWSRIRAMFGGKAKDEARSDERAGEEPPAPPAGA